MDNQFDTIRTVYINNNSSLIYSLKNVLLDKRFNKTDIFRLGRYNRAIASKTRGELNLKFNNKLLDEKTIFIIENNNHLRNLKYLFKNLVIFSNSYRLSQIIYCNGNIFD